MESEKAKTLVIGDTAAAFNLKCLLCRNIFNDPVISSCGHTFCRNCITSGLFGNCKQTNRRAKINPNHENNFSFVVNNIAVGEQVAELDVYCCNGIVFNEKLNEWVAAEYGCKELIKVKNKKEHEAQCQYRLVRCPNSSNCSLIAIKDLPDHLIQCHKFVCPMQKYGCPYVADYQDLLEKHLTASCHLQPLETFILSIESRFEALLQEKEDLLRQKDEEIDFLRTTIANISSRVGILENRLNGLVDIVSGIDKNCVNLRDSMEDLDINNELPEVNGFDERLLLRRRRPYAMSSASGAQSGPNFQCIGTFVGHEGPVWCLTVDGDLLFSGSSDSLIKVWSTSAPYKCIKTLEGHEGIVLCLCVAQQFRKLISGSSDKSVIVWDLSRLELITKIVAHDNPVCSVAVGGEFFFTGSLNQIKVFDVKSHRNERELANVHHWVRALAASSDYLYSAGNRVVTIWSLSHWGRLAEVQAITESIYSLLVTSKYIICGTLENMIKVWDIQTHEAIGTLRGHTGCINGLAILPESAEDCLLSASYDGSVRVWSLIKFSCVQVLIRHENSVSSVVANLQGLIFSGSADETVKVWQT